MRIVELGKINDCTVYAINNVDSFAHIEKGELEFCYGEVIKIKCDSGVYPGINDFEQYICDKAYAKLNL